MKNDKSSVHTLLGAANGWLSGKAQSQPEERIEQLEEADIQTESRRVS
ncbi:hypothetical protein HKB17_05415 [Vibrio parahaemolyticus]|nr:hypothetical protein [Vibrio parahaemolyticus]